MEEAIDRERYEQQEQARQDEGIINYNVYNVIQCIFGVIIVIHAIDQGRSVGWYKEAMDVTSDG